MNEIIYYGGWNADFPNIGTSFDYEDIMQKELTLKNMLKPNSWCEIERMLDQAGFKAVQSFWQNHLFIGAIAIK